MRKIRIAFALMLAAPLAACATSPTIVTARVAGTAESAYQAFVVAQEARVKAGSLDRATFHDQENKAYSALLLVRAGQLTADAYAAQLTTLTGGN